MINEESWTTTQQTKTPYKINIFNKSKKSTNRLTTAGFKTLNESKIDTSRRQDDSPDWAAQVEGPGSLSVFLCSGMAYGCGSKPTSGSFLGDEKVTILL